MESLFLHRDELMLDQTSVILLRYRQTRELCDFVPRYISHGIESAALTLFGKGPLLRISKQFMGQCQYAS